MTSDGATIFLRDEMTDAEKQLFLTDVKKVCSEYFDNGKRYSVDVTGEDGAYSVCVIFSAERIKRVRKPL